MIEFGVRVLAVTGVVVTVAGLLLSLRSARKEARVRRRFEVARVGVGAVGAVVVGVIGSVTTPVAAALAGVAVGGSLGFAQGRQLDVQRRDGALFARRTVLGVVVWFASLAGMQLAGALNRTGMFRLGQTLALAGIAVTLGVMLGRRVPDAETGHPPVTASQAAAVLVVAGAAVMSVLGTLVPDAHGQGAARWVLDEVVVDDNEHAWSSASHSPGSISAAWHLEEGGTFDATFEASYDLPPEALEAGTTWEMNVTVSGAATGTQQRYASLSLIQLIGGRWTSAAVGVNAGCTDPIGTEPLSCSQPDTKTGTFVFDVPSGSRDGTYEFGVSALNGFPSVTWRYRWDAPAEPAPAGELGEGGDSGTSGDVTTGPGGDASIDAEEALGASIAAVLVAAAMGVLTTADAGRAISDAMTLARRGDLAGARRVLDAALDDDLAASRRRDQLELFAQAEDRLIGSIGRGIDSEQFQRLSDEIDAIRERIRGGSATQADIDRLRAVRDEAWDVTLDARAADQQFHETNDRILAAGELAAWAGTVAGKGAAGVIGGPAAAAIVTSLVDGAGAAHLGWDKAVATGVANGIVDGVAGGVMGDLSRLGLTARVGRAGLTNGIAAAAQDYWAQLVANDGDASKVDMDRVRDAGRNGMAIGGLLGGATRHVPDPPGVGGVRPAPFGADDAGHGWGVRTAGADDAATTVRSGGSPSVPEGAATTVRSGGSPSVPEGAATTVRSGGSPSVPEGAATTVRSGGSPSASDGPSGGSRGAPLEPPPARNASLEELGGGSPGTTPQGDPELAELARTPRPPSDPLPASGPPVQGPVGELGQTRWRELDADGAGNVYDVHGNHLYTLDAGGTATTPDGRVVTPLRNERGPIGYVEPSGRQVGFDQAGRPQQVIDHTAPTSATGRELDWDPNFDAGGARRVPIDDVPPAPPTARTELPSDVRTVWTQAGAGPNGELYDAGGRVIGHVDRAGRMTTLDGRRIVSFSNHGNRLVNVVTEP
jgi:hypothetical protein